LKAWVLMASLGAVLLGASVARADEPQWIRKDEAAALKAAAESGKLVLVDIWADWCTWCTRLDEKVFTTPEFAEAAKDFVLLKIDSDANKGYLEKTGQRGLPTTAFLTPDGKVYFARAGYMWTPAYVAMMKLVNETWKTGGDAGELAAKTQKLDEDNMEPEVKAMMEEGERRRAEAERRQAEAAAKAEELVKATGLDYTKGDSGNLVLTVNGVELSIACLAAEAQTLLSVAHSWPMPEGDPTDIAKTILGSNANVVIGTFGMARANEVSLHEQVVADGLNADTTKALLDAVAAVANAYTPGETLARQDPGTGDLAPIKALLTEAGFASTDADGGLTVNAGNTDIKVTAGITTFALYVDLGLKTDDEKVAPLVPSLAAISGVIGSAKILAAEDGSLGLAFVGPTAGLDSAAMKYYVDNLPRVRTGVSRWVQQQSGQK